MSLGKFKSNTQNANNLDESEYDFLPSIGIRAKYGITDKIDGGINIDLSTNIGFTGKYQFIGKRDNKFNSSIGVDFGANLIGVFNYKLFYYYSIPLYLSYGFKETITTFVTPRMINNSEYVFSNKYGKETVGEKFNSTNVSLCYGILFGKKDKYGFEISHNSSKILQPTEIAFGYNFRF